MKSVMLAKGGGMATALSLGAGYFLSQHRPPQPTVVSGDQTLISPYDAGDSEEGSKTNGGGIKDGVGIMRFEEASPNFTSSTMITSSILRYPRFPGEELDCSSSENEEDSEKSEGSINSEKNEVTDMIKQEISDLKNFLQSLQEKEAKLEVQLLEFSGLKEQGTIIRELKNQVRMIDKESREEITELKEKETKLEIQILDYSNHREQEIVELKNSLDALVEREARLELQLLNYNKFKEEVTVVKDLETRLKIADVESQLSAAKTEAMRSENRRLEVELSVHSKVRAQLVAAGEKIKRLKKKMRSNSKKAKEKISTLRKRISALQQKESEILNHVRSVEGNLDVLKDLEEEAEDLRTTNLRLTQENSDLAKKLETESNRTPASTIFESSKINEAKEEIDKLRQANDELMKQIEQVRADQSSEIEKAVYLRWINACLRHELRNYRPAPAKIAARDLKYSPSPKSAEKARDLLQYVYSDDESPIEIDLKYCSSSHSPQHRSSSHSPQHPEIEIEKKLDDDDDGDVISITKDDHSTKKPRFLGHLKKLMLGKDSHKLHNNQNSPIDDAPQRISFESIDLNGEESRTTHGVGRSRSDSRLLSSSSSKCKRFISTETNMTNSFPDQITRSRHRKATGTPERPQLRTFVGGLKHTSNSVGLLHRPTSFSRC